ncbi:MAG: sialate O-acetylesterase [Verrucomicrobiae bacterium]|nr:sialate O-acetylesterase [Verrucomicrobiae bacterium]
MKSRPIPRAIDTLAVIGLLLLSPSALMAKLELHPLFTDHGVLQQELPVPVWGWSDPGAEISVTFGGQTKTTTAAADGRWMTILAPLTANAEPADLLVKNAAESVKVSDLLVGEVWLCSGQSNMAMSVRGTTDAAAMEAEAGTAKLKDVRLFRVPVDGTDNRQDSVKATWTPCNPATVSAFSAVGFYFGRALHTARNVPIGLIQSANGGTNAYSWINRDTLENDPAAAPTRAFWEQTVANYPQAAANYEKALATWKEKVAAAKAAGNPAPRGSAPREPIGPTHVKRPAGHYQAMIAPLQPFAIRGVIWYQGEANSRAHFAPQYKDLMFALLEDWRADWAGAAPDLERRNFPFYLVQLPNFGGGHEKGWPVIREQMLRFWQEGENTGMAVAIDVGDPKNIHPNNKKPVGERLARFARAQTYGEDLVYSGPIFDSLTIEGGKAILKFKHLGGGLISTDQQALRHFTIAGTESIFVKANAEIVGDTVVVSSPDVPDPRAVRYAWSNNPENVNFANQAGLPASPFRTDSWEIIVE